MSDAVLICLLPGCGEQLSPPKTKFCCRKHAQKFHNDERDLPLEQQREYSKNRRAANPEAARERARIYYAKNKERMAARQNAYYHANKERCKAINRRVHERYPFHALLRTAKSRATEKFLQFDLTWEWAKDVWTGKCAITDLPFVKGDGAGPSPYSPSIDRVLASKGYTKDNSRFVLMAVNGLKGRGTDADMYAIARAIVASEPD